VNFMAGNLTDQVRNIAQVTTAVANGDLTQKITVDVKGEVLELKNTINTMVDQLSAFAAEVTRVATEVGTEGRLGGQAQVPGVSGTWKDLTESVNFMAGNLTDQVRNIAQVTTAVANGDLSQKITVDVKGEVLELKNTINTMVDQLSAFAAEVTRVAREVGTEGRLGGQAEVAGVSGTWRDLTESVNFMAGNLTDQVRNIAQVTTAVANGDLSQKITVDVKGEVLELKNTINTMVDQLRSFADEVTRVATEVGTEGRLGGQAQVPGVSGTWKDLTESVNFMAGNLTAQVRNIAQVTTAVARGDLSQKITVDVKGEVLELKNTINTMVDQLSAFADEVTRVAREVGTEGRLGGQAKVADVSGTWKDLTESVNFMAGNLTDQVRNIAQVTTAVANGDLSQKITVDARGEVAALRDTINTMVDQLRSFAAEVTRVAREVGTEGRLGGQAHVEGVAGTWKDLTENVNHLAGNLTSQVRNIAQVTTAVARGDLSQKITVDARGEVAELKNTVNTMVDQLSAFADEVTRVAREVGTEGALGGQARVPAVSGVWKDLTDNVNSMAGNLTDQVRNIAQVTTAVARGDLSKKITVSARGEILELKDTINTMVDQLSAFAAEVTRVAREVGTEGRLGGQARVQGVSGTWRDLTHNVNQLASNLTTQVRAIGEVSTAVARGDLTRQIAVDAEGEVAELKDNVNQMIANLRDTTQKNAEQDWLKSNLARISGLMQGQRNLETVCQLIMSEVTPLVGAETGAMFLVDRQDGEEVAYGFIAGFGVTRKARRTKRFRPGDGLVGQAALDKRPIHVRAPNGYLPIQSGLGSLDATHVAVLPVLFEDEVLAVMELASFSPFSEAHSSFFDEFLGTLGIVLNTITANVRTEELLKQSQLLTHELQHTNDEIAEKARLLELQNRDIEVKNREIEAAQVALQERAEQLALSSKYKSEFLANMSHELRTPLNSLLILAKLLTEDAEGNLTSKQIDYAGTIYGAGSDLLALINDILDLSKVEAGKMQLHPSQITVVNMIDDLVHTFRAGADQKNLTLDVHFDGDVPNQMFSDEQRFQQVLRNLLSNALKFTEVGGVRIDVRRAPHDLDFKAPWLRNAPDRVIEFAVSDTGIGVGPEQLRLIFEAFQQADGTTSRRYGGTGLGLSISREITALLGGELRATSVPGMGSTFTLYLPEEGEFAPDQFSVTASVTPWAEVALDRHAVALDDRGRMVPEDSRLLVVGDNQTSDLAATVARRLGFKVLTSADEAAALETARRYAPDAIVLTPGAGPDVIELLEELKSRPTTRHLPVYVGVDADAWRNARRLGAAGRLNTPLSKSELEQVLTAERAHKDKPRCVVIVSTDERRRHDMVALLGGDRIETISAQTAADARVILDERNVDCIVCDVVTPKTDGLALLDELAAAGSDVPVVLPHRADELDPEDQARLETLSLAVTIRSTDSPQELFSTTALYLHRPVGVRIDETRSVGRFERDPVLLNRRVLIVDDDVRNVFAVSAALEAHGMSVIYADNGRDGIAVLQQQPEVDLVLMDIMMPEMDGYETMRAIRQRPSLASLPIIALTAKALTGDREKAIAAGASDYVTKPVDIDRLLTVLRVWLNDDADEPSTRE
jgi:HAMP domain-containing protein/signal transduction histidine kinase/DNA-binding response OmpR family regulator